MSWARVVAVSVRRPTGVVALAQGTASALALALALVACGGAPWPASPGEPGPGGGGSDIWRPPPAVTWQWQLTTPVDRSVEAQVFDIDLFDNDAAVVEALHGQDRRVVCYVSAGSWEDWRPDAATFPAEVLGDGNGWPGERWLDIRRLDVLAPIMGARLDQCRAKGFDGVEPDNVDGYANRSGFPLSYADQLAYNRWLAVEAHRRGLAVALKNDLGQVPDLVADFDFALAEGCVRFAECDRLDPFVSAGKAVLHVEYEPATCPPRRSGFSSVVKRPELDAFVVRC